MTYPGPGEDTQYSPGQSPATSPFPSQTPSLPANDAPGSPPQQRNPTSPGPAWPTSPAPASPPGNQDNYVLAVDLGTSHTVAVIRWPDQRTRPLLVDGAPVMPSAVFLDEAGHIHVGRDAQRLAQTDPIRFEPNPKHRIAEATVLLGDREVTVTSLLAAVLRQVASKAIEAVGQLPPAVLTYPAQWGAQRRSALEDAAAQAGFPPVRMVPEPVAAAHYFAEVIRQPIPPGSSVGVFDFGGGTLDVAVVRHESAGTFSVQADGGLDDLGGLDVDASLVESLGATISANAPHVWQQLEQPSSATDRRHRRLFWDDVRGGKEMLSRTTVAPIPVPSVEASLHLTREELENLATPLLTRAVEETQRVISATGQAPDQLAGLFLVGGASRMPLVARMLHSRLGIAPTVLEQPELPVAEGSLAAVFPAAEPASAASAAETTTMNAAPEGPLPQPAQPKPWPKRKSTWIGAAAVAALLGVGVGWLIYDPYPANEMSPLSPVSGEAVEFPKGVGGSPSVHKPYVHDDTAYFAADNYGMTRVTAMDMATGKETWTSPKLNFEQSAGIHQRNNVLYVVDNSEYENTKLTFLDIETGEKREQVKISSGTTRKIVGDQFITMDGKTVEGRNADGSKAWASKLDFAPGAMELVDSWSELAQPRGSANVEDPYRVMVKNGEGEVAVLDTQNEGKVLASEKLGDESSMYHAYEDKIYVLNDEKSPKLDVFNLDDLSPAGQARLDGAAQPESIAPCGQTLMCALGDTDDNDGAEQLTAVDISSDDPKVAWQTEKNDKIYDFQVMGDQLMLLRDRTTDSEDRADGLQVVNAADGEKIEKEHKGLGFKRINAGNLMNYPESPDMSSSSPEEASFRGFSADGVRYELGTLNVYPQCVANETLLACPTDSGYQSWSFVS